MNPSVTLTVYVASPSLVFLVKARRWIRRTLCVLVNGGHELYRVHSDARIYQECLLCGHETPGWTIDRRDRRLHLVDKRKAS